MSRITSFFGLDSSDLISPADILTTFSRRLNAYRAAEARFNEYHATLSDGELAYPSADQSDRLDRLEARFASLSGPMFDAQDDAIEAIRAAGCDVNRGAIRSGGQLFAIAQHDDAPHPSVVIINLADIRDLG